MLNVKNADMADFEQIMKIYKYAQDYMIKSGCRGDIHDRWSSIYDHCPKQRVWK